MKIINYVHYENSKAKQHIKKAFKYYLQAYDPTIHNFIVFLCVGSDRITGDAVGPLVGYFLKDISQKENIRIIGDLHYPVHANNLTDILEYTYETFINPFVIAIDSSFGKTEDEEGWIHISNGEISPGSGLQKNMNSFGNISISACTASLEEADQTMRFLIMQGTRLKPVVFMAEIIAKSIIEVMKKIEII